MIYHTNLWQCHSSPTNTKITGMKEKIGNEGYFDLGEYQWHSSKNNPGAATLRHFVYFLSVAPRLRYRREAMQGLIFVCRILSNIFSSANFRPGILRLAFFRRAVFRRAFFVLIFVFVYTTFHPFIFRLEIYSFG